MKTKSWANIISIETITSTIDTMVRNGEISNIIAFSHSSTFNSNENNLRYSAILIYTK